MLAPLHADEKRWLACVMAHLTEAHRFRILAIVDGRRRECRALMLDTSLPGMQFVRELGRLWPGRAQRPGRGRRRIIVGDKGNAVNWNPIRPCVDQIRVEWNHHAPGLPMQSGLIARLNGRLRDEPPSERLRAAPAPARLTVP